MQYGRLILYMVSLALLGLYFYFLSQPAVEYKMLAITIRKYFLVSFLLVSADTGIRLNGSPYLVLPVVMALSLLMESLFGVPGSGANIASQLLQVSGMATTASLLLGKVFRERKEGMHARIHPYMIGAAVACTIVALRFLFPVFTDKITDDILHYWTQAGFILLAVISTAALVQYLFGKHKKEREVFIYLLYIAIFAVMIDLVRV